MGKKELTERGEDFILKLLREALLSGSAAEFGLRQGLTVLKVFTN